MRLVAAGGSTECPPFRLAWNLMAGSVLVALLIGHWAPGVPVSGVTALLLLLGRPLIDRRAAALAGPSAVVTTWLYLSAGSLAFLLITLLVLWGSLPPWAPGPGRQGTAYLGPLLPMAGLVPLLLAVTGVPAVLRRRSVDLLCWAVWTHLAGSVVLLGLAGHRDLRHGDFAQRDRYLASLPVALSLPSIPEDRPSLDLSAKGWHLPVFRTVAGEFQAQRVLDEQRCWLSLARQGSAWARPILQDSVLVSQFTCWQVTFRRDRHTGQIFAFTEQGQLFGVAQEPGLVLVPPSHSHIARELAPPSGWAMASLAGILGALGVLLSRRSRLRWLRLQKDWIAGELLLDGRVIVHGGAPPCRAPVGLRLVPGPVVVVSLGPRRPATYRDMGDLGPVAVLGGTPGELALQLGAQRWAGYACALALLSITSAPLVSAALVGLLW